MSSSESDHKTHGESRQQIPASNGETSKEVIDALIHSKTLEESEQSKMPISEDQEEDDDEEEEGECAFCLFMKGGGCKDAFVAWENCIKEVESKNEDIVEKCFELTSALKLCMEADPDYYAPILSAEKAAEEEALNELAKEKAAAVEEEKESESNEKAKEE